ncbi:hypothetical protein [Sicyoidochytrium minutum DNA virus]|nr:hypothetical protein [Sicyoidochytrium minutum DNA virus]
MPSWSYTSYSYEKRIIFMNQ